MNNTIVDNQKLLKGDNLSTNVVEKERRQWQMEKF